MEVGTRPRSRYVPPQPTPYAQAPHAGRRLPLGDAQPTRSAMVRPWCRTPRRHSPALSTTTRRAATVSLRASRPESVPACLAGSATLDLPSPRQTMPAPTAAPTLPARTRTDRVHRPGAGPAALDQVRAAARLAD